LATHVNDVLGSQSRDETVPAAFDLADALRAAFRIQRRPKLGEG
jgi:hypothetical protein